MFESKDEGTPDDGEKVPVPEGDEAPRKEAVPVDPAECSPPDDDDADEGGDPEGMHALPPAVAKALEGALKRALDETKADAVQEGERKYRDQFAVVAMESVVRVRLLQGGDSPPDKMAREAYDIAEAMLTERAVRESFGNRRSAEVVEAITSGRAQMKAHLNEAEKIVGLAESMNEGAAKAREHATEVLTADHIRESRLNRVRELVEGEISLGLSPDLIAVDCGCSQLEAQELLEVVRAERQE